MRSFAATILLILALSGTAAADARTPLDGVWIFDRARDNPAVTMPEVENKGGTIAGRVAAHWHGPIR